MSYDRSPGGVMNPPGSPSNRSTTSSIGPISPGSSTGKAYGRVKVLHNTHNHLCTHTRRKKLYAFLISFIQY